MAVVLLKLINNKNSQKPNLGLKFCKNMIPGSGCSNDLTSNNDWTVGGGSGSDRATLKLPPIKAKSMTYDTALKNGTIGYYIL